MDYETFRHRVCEEADLAGNEEADEAIAATLVTLSERVPDEDAWSLAEQLPDAVGGHLTAADGSKSFGYDEFVARVAGREDVAAPDLEAAERHARTVIAVLLEAVQPRTSNDVLEVLTDDYEQLFELVDPEAVWGPGWRNRLGQRG